MLDEYVKKYLEWMEENGIEANIFKDGIVNYDVWESSKFKPLFVLREVHDIPDEDTWGKIYNFLDDKNDVKRGVSPTWIRVALLADGLKKSYDGIEAKYEYQTYERGEKENWNHRKEYRNIIEHIAVINLKKISGGNYKNSLESQKTKCYTEHIDYFKEELMNQIAEIKPNLIVLCGKGLLDECKDILFTENENISKESGYYFSDNEHCLANGCMVFEVYHPSFGSGRKKNYEKTFELYNKLIHEQCE